MRDEKNFGGGPLFIKLFQFGKINNKTTHDILHTLWHATVFTACMFACLFLHWDRQVFGQLHELAFVLTVAAGARALWNGFQLPEYA